MANTRDQGDQLSEEDKSEIRRLILVSGGLPARDWLVRERGYSPQEAKAIVDPFLDEDIATATPLWDLAGGLLWLAAGIGLAVIGFAVAEGGGRLYNRLLFGALIVGGFLFLRGLWMTGIYVRTRWGGWRR